MLTAVLAPLFSMGVIAGASEPQNRRDADVMQAKLVQIVARGEECPCPRRHSTTITEHEVNGYLRHHAAEDLPDGVVAPYITIVGAGRVAGRAIVDLDRVRTSRQRGWLDPAAYLTGKLPVTAAGILHTRDGIGRFELETATVGGFTVPKAVLQELLTYYSRSPDDPDGLNLDETFELPAKIREIQVGKSVAYVIQ
ncbi:MAG: hypothetical protein WD690_18770 [Vicinamibacterales bacterium]